MHVNSRVCNQLVTNGAYFEIPVAFKTGRMCPDTNGADCRFPEQFGQDLKNQRPTLLERGHDLSGCI